MLTKNNKCWHAIVGKKVTGKKVTDKKSQEKSNGNEVTGPIIHEIQASNNFDQTCSTFSPDTNACIVSSIACSDDSILQPFMAILHCTRPLELVAKVPLPPAIYL